MQSQEEHGTSPAFGIIDHFVALLADDDSAGSPVVPVRSMVGSVIDENSIIGREVLRYSIRRQLIGGVEAGPREAALDSVCGGIHITSIVGIFCTLSCFGEGLGDFLG